MFAPKIAKAPTKAPESPTRKPAPQPSTLVARSFGGGAVEQARMLQKTIGNQATLRLLAQRTSNLTKNRPGGGHEQEADLANLTSRGATPGVSWDLTQIPVFPPVRLDQSQPLFALTRRSLPSTIQPKLAVGPVDDPLEHEADRIADHVIRMPAPVADPAWSPVPPQVSRKCAACEEEEKLQKKEAGPHAAATGEAPAGVHEVLCSPGQPLDKATLDYFEPRFGHDFGRVRVHTDQQAAASASDMRAKAYAVGQHLIFGAGEYDPASETGRRLIAHELTHVVQQKNTRQSEQVQRAPGGDSEEPPIAGTPDNTIEMWKDIIAHRHFQQSEGDITFARLKILDKKGRVVVNILTESDKSLHAEEKAIGIARKQIDKGKENVEGGKIIFVTDQTVCDKPGRWCRDQINKLAEELGVEEATAEIIRRQALPQEREGPLAGPKATAKKVQKRVVEGLELITSTETIYKRGRNLPGGGGTLAPVKPPAQAASGEVITGEEVPLKPTVPPVGQGRGRLSSAAEAEAAEEFEAGGGGAFGGVAVVIVEVIGPMLHALASALIPALTNTLWDQDKTKLEAEILQRLNQPDTLRRIADYQIDEPGLALYGNVIVEIVTEDALQTVGTTEKGFPIMNAVSYYASSRLIDVKTSNRDVKSSTEKTDSRNLMGQSTTVHTVTQTYSFALPQLENKFVMRVRLKERIAEVDREMARSPSQGDNFSLQLLRDQLAMRLRLYQSD